MTLFFIGLGSLKLLSFVFFILLIIKIAILIKLRVHGKHSDLLKNHGTYQAVSLAASRFAKGDISAEQYREIKSVLKE